MRIIKLLLFTFLFVCYQANALIAIPAYSQRVVDTTNTLTSTQITQLENKLIDYEVAKGDSSQIAVLLIATLEGESIEQYAMRVFEQWKIGQKGADNGILLIVAKDDREVRIEVGYGFEGDLPDLKTKYIIDQKIIPAFRENNYYQGIDAALTAIINELNHTEQNELNSVKPISSVKEVFNDEFGSVLLNYAGVSFIICLFIGRILPFSTLKKSVGKRSLATGLINAVSTGGFTLLQGFPFSVVLPVLFLTFVVSTILCGIFSLSKSGGGGSYRGPRGGSGGGFGGSRGGFGGGGGGRSGGGGASGRW